jgi:hydroxymethylpyrimidine/phosphomethylpyrimidine kinase
VLVKGGHFDEREAIDLLLDGDEVRTFRAERLHGRGTHGTGCTLSAALATWLGRGQSLARAVELSKRFVTEAIRHGLDVGHGHQPTNPFFFLEGRDWTHFTADPADPAGPAGHAEGGGSC